MMFRLTSETSPLLTNFRSMSMNKRFYVVSTNAQDPLHTFPRNFSVYTGKLIIIIIIISDDTGLQLPLISL